MKKRSKQPEPETSDLIEQCLEQTTAIENVFGAIAGLEPKVALAVLQQATAMLASKVITPAADLFDSEIDEIEAASEMALGSSDSRIRQAILVIRELGEDATSAAIAKRLKVGKGGVSFRMRPLKEADLVLPPPKGGAAGGRPWRLTPKASDWLHKHGNGAA